MLKIRQPGETLSVNEKNEIFRTKAGGFGYDMPPSGQWLLVGAVEYRMVFGRYVPVRRYTVDEIRTGKVPWRYKNGEQRCFILDRDHGSLREWRSPTPYTAYSLV